LGSDASGVLDDGREVIVHAVIGDPSKGDETLDPKRSLLSEVHDGTHAEYVTVPAYNVIDKPDFLSFEEAISKTMDLNTSIVLATTLVMKSKTVFFPSPALLASASKICLAIGLYL
jgi:NADPH:quinone reductase-like Zn-dependent oxidoreductase